MTNSNEIDDATLEALGETLPPEEAKRAVEVMVRDSITLAQRIENGEEFLKKLKGELHDILSKKMPDALASLGTTAFVIDEGDLEGWGVEIKPFVGGSFPKDEEKRVEALNYMREIDGENLIKNSIEAYFDKGSDNSAKVVKATLDELGIPFESSTTVHHQTLLSFVNERMKNGEETDMAKLGLFAGRAAKVKEPKVKKPKKTKAAKG